MAQRATERAAVASLAMADVQDCLMHQRATLADEVGKFEVALASHGPDFERAVAFPDEGEPLDLVKVDDMVGQYKPHVQHRHQRLPAGQELGVVELAQEGDGIADSAGVVVAERRWLHKAFDRDGASLRQIGARLAIWCEPFLNPKKKKSPKYETLRNLSAVVPGASKARTRNPGQDGTKEDGFRAPALCAVPGMMPMVIAR